MEAVTLGFEVEGAGFFPSDVFNFEEPRMVKDGLESDVGAMSMVVGRKRISYFVP